MVQRADMRPGPSHDRNPTPQPDFVFNTKKIKTTHTPGIPLQQYRATLIGRGESFSQHDTGSHTQSAARYSTMTPWRHSHTPRDSATTPGACATDWWPFDWWPFDWVWTASHLEDGTGVHGVTVHVPPAPVLVGYIQGLRIPICELSGVDIVKEVAHVAPDCLPKIAIIGYSSEAAKKAVPHIKPRGQDPIKLLSPDGRLTLLPRLWAKVEAHDGRRGVS
ncbi:uncharacterized protein BJX67DRAFT_381253 [Aspergillus lucknowensis]|uniref:DUF7064 domain-containing protein n=1 Tax=Aspergillus lucknowensis TaxID=176173 RepID=A0ABR4LV68_9EURO